MKKIFISSTFKDMQKERDLLHARVLPEINSQLQKRGDFAQFLDFRWGVNTEKLKNDEALKRVLSTCFDGIANSAYILVFVGNSYGTCVSTNTVKDIAEQYGINNYADESSITELEIAFAMQNEFINADNVLFYFKSCSEDQYVDPRVKRMKEQILKKFSSQVRFYNDDFENTTNDLVDSLVHDFMNIFNRNVPFDGILEDKKENLSANYANRFSCRYDLINYAMKAIYKNRVTIISGESGSGKTVFVSALREKVRDNSNTVINYVSRTCFFAENIKRVVWNFVGETLKFKYKLDLPRECYGLPHEKSISAQCKVISNTANIKPFIVFIDGLDKMETESEINETIDFIAKFCDDIHFVISMANSDEYVFPIEIEQIQLTPLSDHDKLALIKHELENYNKDLDDLAITLLINKQDSYIPLYLTLAIKRLILMQENDFLNIEKEKQQRFFINEHIQSIDTDISFIINNHIHNIISDFSEDIENLIIDFIEFCMNIVGNKTFAINAISFMSSSILGYTDTEILLLIDKNAFSANPEWTSFRNQILVLGMDNPFANDFVECDLYWFRKYLDIVLFQDFWGRNKFENVIVKNSVYNLYNCKGVCDRGISECLEEPESERCVSNYEIVSAIIRRQNWNWLFWVLEQVYESDNSMAICNVLMHNIKNNKNILCDFLKFVKRRNHDKTIFGVLFFVKKLLPFMVKSYMNPLPYIPFFEQCLDILKFRLDYTLLENRLFLIMSRLNIAIFLRNNGYNEQALIIGKKCINLLKAIPKNIRGDMYYEALKDVYNFMSF